MDIEAMELQQFKKYESDWTYPLHIRRAFAPGTPFKGRCVSFQAAMEMTLITGQCFALNPVIGVGNDDATKLRFSFKSWRCIYTLVSIIGQGMLVSFCLTATFKDEHSDLGSSTSLVFHIMTWLTTMIFFRIAMKWPQLCLQISRTEAADPNTDYSLRRRCNQACFVVLILASLEHALIILTGMAVAMDCDPQLNLYESYITHGFPWIFQYIPYNHFFGLVVQFLNIQSTFNWNFADVFVICISFYLASRLEQVNQRIMAVRGKFVPSSFWRTMREDYTRLANIVRTVDEIIGEVIFISFSNNLFFICMQLLHTLADGVKATPRCRLELDIDIRPLGGYEQPVYFTYSFIFLMLRSVAVSLTAARVHTASKMAAVSLYDVDSSSYCIEIQRFLEQIHGDTVALSGLQFFYVKRGLVLAIAGTIVTYELVLMQFTGVTPTSATPI